MSWDWERLKDQQRKRGDIPPQMDDFIKKINDFKMPGGPFLVVLLIIGLFSTSMFYTVKPSEEGVVQRFGKFVRLTQPGLHFKLPVGIETVKKVNVRQVRTEEFSARSSVNDPRFSNIGDDAILMLTGDLNVGLVPWIVQYRVNDTYNYLFKVRDVQQLLRDMSEATMRIIVGDRSIDEVISKRDEIAIDAKELLQSEMDHAEAGIYIVTVEMKKTDVPEPVQPSFNEVNQATQEKEQMIYQAREEYNKAIPAALGEAERTIRAAEGYALDRVNRAQGDSSRFKAMYDEYIKAEDITRRRLYLEALKDILPRLEQKYIIDADQKNLLPLLNLEKQNGAIR